MCVLVRAGVRVSGLLRSAGRTSMLCLVRDWTAGEDGLRTRARRVYSVRRVGWLVIAEMMERPCWLVAGRMVRIWEDIVWLVGCG